MKELRDATVSARVTRRVRVLVEAAAQTAGTTVSRLTAEAAEAQARKVLLGEVSELRGPAGQADGGEAKSTNDESDLFSWTLDLAERERHDG